MDQRPEHASRLCLADGYGVFTIGISQVNSTVHYIQDQKRHHAKFSFSDELKMILKKHGLSWVDE